jgi:hypothetical protein
VLSGFAPDLVGWADEKMQHCFWKRQPETPTEIERAIAVLEAQELECHPDPSPDYMLRLSDAVTEGTRTGRTTAVTFCARRGFPRSTH